MLLFSKEVNDWLAQHPENVVAIHCKGGKGNAASLSFPFEKKRAWELLLLIILIINTKILASKQTDARRKGRK